MRVPARTRARGLSVSPIARIALRHGLPAECVDASPSATCRRRLLPDGVRAG